MLERLLIPVLLLLPVAAPAQQEREPIGSAKLVEVEVETESVVYKATPQGELKLHFFLPPSHSKKEGDSPAILFFFGGGWKKGTIQQFVPHANYFATRGLVAVCAEYRILDEHGTTPDKSVADAKSAMRWLRSHAAEWGVDPKRIIASGGSAGGHLAAATAMLPGFDEPGEDTSVSCRPAALVLFNPALNITLIEDRTVLDAEGEDITEAISPTLFLQADAPPAVIFFGTEDDLGSHGVEYREKALALGLRADLWLAQDQKHGFFNRSPWIEATTKQSDRFLAELGLLHGEPVLRPIEVRLDAAE